MTLLVQVVPLGLAATLFKLPTGMYDITIL